LSAIRAAVQRGHLNEPNPSAEADSRLYVLLSLCQKSRAYRTFQPQRPSRYREFPFWEPPSLLKVKGSLPRFVKTVKQKHAFFAEKMKNFSFFFKIFPNTQLFASSALKKICRKSCCQAFFVAI
jgi:hypothetical protein